MENILSDNASPRCLLAFQLVLWTHRLFVEMGEMVVKLLSNKENELEVFYFLGLVEKNL